MIPGHSKPSEYQRESVAITRDYINYVRNATRKAVADFVPFDEAYKTTDWSAYKEMPAFSAGNRGNAYRIYLEMEAESLK